MFCLNRTEMRWRTIYLGDYTLPVPQRRFTAQTGLKLIDCREGMLNQRGRKKGKLSWRS